MKKNSFKNAFLKMGLFFKEKVGPKVKRVLISIGDFFKKQIVQKILYGALYFTLVCGFVASACFAFSRLYYEHIYVSGTSMNPTLIGNGVFTNQEEIHNGYSHYGKADTSRRVVSRLERFDVLITYFPNTWPGSSETDDTYKIKRIWGLPGETIVMKTVVKVEQEYLSFTVSKDEQVIAEYEALIRKAVPITVDGSNKKMDLATFSCSSKSFNICCGYNGVTNSIRRFNKTLKDDEYFLMGDNWNVSFDSYKNIDRSAYINTDLIRGKVVQIEGVAQIKDGKLINKRRIKGMVNF